MTCLFVVFLVFVVFTPCLSSRITTKKDCIFNVLDYGASGDGETDDTNAFKAAWDEACGATKNTPTLLIPIGKTFKLQPVHFKGPCKSQSVHVNLQGIIIAPRRDDDWKWSDNDRATWIRFYDINGLVISGGGVIDGKGDSWWSCKSNKKCPKPSALSINCCPDLKLMGLTSINSPRNHLSINQCNGSFISDLRISAPDDSPNTDGVDISESSHMVLQNSIIGTGDDCIAINSGSSFINITGVICGPGHGISIGSLGKNGSYATVEEVNVTNCTFVETTNGVRIKTWKGGSGYARKITFKDIILQHVQNPVIITQQYVDNHSFGSSSPKRNKTNYGSSSAVALSDITYKNVRGTSESEEAIQLICDKNVGCTNIVLEGINIKSSNGGKTHATCQNAHGTFSSCTPNVPCLD
ncbi:hypothetical protein TanjilG_16620 [Lupinus angustifolius]|uniref:Polygalacturonase n=1 Tax=Lupinus angustifolius TaxID=3871 RepID=A0A4P1R024_LUPAN|nr:hypothetical protein TanjilG_16620 [Lupinus angustifolius]